MENPKEIEEAIQKLEIGKAYIRGKIDGYNESMDKAQEIIKEIFPNKEQQDTSFNPTANTKC